MAMTRPSSGPAQEGAHARPSSARLHFTGTFYPNQSSVKIGDERKKGVEEDWMSIYKAEFSRSPDGRPSTSAGDLRGKGPAQRSRMRVGPDGEDILDVLARKIRQQRGGTHELLSWLRRQADAHECITRNTCKMLLQRFTVYIDRDDEEAFVDIFDPDRADKINYKDLLSTIDPELFNWHYEPPEWVPSSEWVQWYGHSRARGRVLR